MNRKYGQHIGESLGTVLDMDVDENDDDTSWGWFFNVRVEIDLKKSVSSRFINVRWEKFWFPIKYEKLLKLCFTCGRILYTRGAKKNR